MKPLLIIFAAVQLMVPHNVDVQIGGQPYHILFQETVLGPQNHFDTLAIRPVASRVRCATVVMPGEIVFSSKLSLKEQAKAIIHEAVHVGQTCDWRNMATDERVAEDVSDVMQSPIGPFLVEELK